MLVKPIDILNLQKDSIKRLLNFHEDDISIYREPRWKVLIYDKSGCDIISPLFSISELRENEVTVPLQFETNREPIEECVAIYFIEPSEENLSRLCEDLRDKLYPKFYLSFIKPIPRLSLEYLARRVLEINCKSLIQKIFDEYLLFISLTPNLFLSRNKNDPRLTFQQINSKSATVEEMDLTIAEIVNSLFCVFTTIGVIPIIKFVKGGCAETVARKLDKKIRDYIVETKGSFGGHFSTNRPLFFLFDRDVDLIPPLFHSWSYLALLDDILGISLNRVVLHEDTVTSYDLNFFIDRFLQDNMFKPFHTVAGNIQHEVNNFKQSEQRLKAANSNVDDEILEDVWQTNTSKLTSAINSLPELMTRKKLLDMHTNLASKLMDIVKSSKVDRFTELETKILSRTLKDSNEIFEIVNSTDYSDFDKIRMVSISLLCDYLSKSDIGRLQGLLDASNYSSLVDYIFEYKNVCKITNPSFQTSSSSIYSHVFSKIVSKSPNILQGVKSLMMGEKGFMLTQIVQSLFETGETDIADLATLDPKQTMDGSYRNMVNCDEIVVYVVGGGCYTEYQDIMSILNKKHLSSKNIIYGCTEMMNAQYFIDQLCNLGKV